MARLLITGGGGMVGRALMRHPGASAWEVLAPRRAELDLRDRNAVHTYIAENRPDAIVHAAGKVGGIQANMTDPVGFLFENCDIGTNLVMAARDAGVLRLINLGSSCMYPRDRDILIEDDVLSGTLEPTNEGYALAKIMVARLCRYVSQMDPACSYRTLIPPNLFGPWDNFDPVRSHLLPAIISKVHSARTARSDTVEIWGDGTARREFMFVDDLAGAVYWALDRIADLPDLLNVGIGGDHSINDYYAAVAGAVGWDGRFVHDLSKPVGMKRKLMDSRKAASLGWEPTTSLQDGITTTYRWYLETNA